MGDLRTAVHERDLARRGRWVVAREYRGLWTAFGRYATPEEAGRIARGLDNEDSRARVIPPLGTN